MTPATREQIRAAMVNGTRGDAKRMELPVGFGDLDWDRQEFLGWRDPKAPQRGYLVAWQGDQLVGVALRAPDRVSTRPVMCALCHTTHSTSNVALFAAARPGASGRHGNTVGTYICADLACSRYARMARATPEIRPEPGVEVEDRLVGLRSRTGAFIERLLDHPQD